MPPSATIRVTPSRLRVGARAQIVARVDPPTAVRGPRFVISRRSGGEPAWHDASPGGEPGLYHLAHAFDRAGQYQITFVASTSHGEIRAFADATVAERAEGEHAEGAPAGGDPSSAVSPLAGGSSGAGPGPSPGSNADGDDEDKPPDAAPRSLSVPPSPLPPAVPSPFSSPYAAPW